MTRLLVSVTSPEEAVQALGAGAQVIDAKDPKKGALGALPPLVVKAIVSAVGGAAEVSAAAGDDASINVIGDYAAAGASYVKLAVPEGEASAALLTFVGKSLAGKHRLVAVLPARKEPDLGLVAIAGMAGFSGVMLDTDDKSAGLMTVMEMAEIAHFVAAARRANLMVGLAGGLKIGDIPTLLPLRPDVIGFRGGVSVGGRRENALDPAMVRAIATAMTLHAARLSAAE